MTTIPETPNPQNGDTPGLTIKPYGAEVFTDFERRKHFVVLFYRLDAATRTRVLAWIGEVLDDLNRAGLHVSDAIKSQITAEGQSRTEPLTAKTRFRCHLEVPVKPLTQSKAEEQAFVDAVRTATLGTRPSSTP